MFSIEEFRPQGLDTFASFFRIHDHDLGSDIFLLIFRRLWLLDSIRFRV